MNFCLIDSVVLVLRCCPSEVLTHVTFTQAHKMRQSYENYNSVNRLINCDFGARTFHVLIVNCCNCSYDFK